MKYGIDIQTIDTETDEAQVNVADNAQVTVLSANPVGQGHQIVVAVVIPVEERPPAKPRARQARRVDASGRDESAPVAADSAA